MTRQERYRLAGEVGVHPRTVIRWLEGKDVAYPTAYALVLAAKKLKIDIPSDKTGTEG